VTISFSKNILHHKVSKEVYSKDYTERIYNDCVSTTNDINDYA